MLDFFLCPIKSNAGDIRNSRDGPSELCDQLLSVQEARAGGHHMLAKTFVAIFGLFLCCATPTSASAFCGTISATGSGLSDADALKAANAIGLIEVRKLNKEYGAANVKYQPAKHNCRGASHSTCAITQKYCVTIPKTGPDLCPGDSVRNKKGQCVKEDEPVRANPCSNGRLFSLSAQICHCPSDRPVWTGSSCISSRPVNGPTNKQIIDRCNLLDRECKKGITGSCKALKAYCERG